MVYWGIPCMTGVGYTNSALSFGYNELCYTVICSMVNRISHDKVTMTKYMYARFEYIYKLHVLWNFCKGQDDHFNNLENKFCSIILWPGFAYTYIDLNYSGSGNGLLPGGTKPLNHQWGLVASHWHHAITCSLALTHWGRVTHICVSKLAVIGSNNGL